MTIRLVVTSTDASLEKLLTFVKDLRHEHEEQIELLDRAVKWLKACDRPLYGPNPAEVSASLSLGDTPQSNSKLRHTD